MILDNKNPLAKELTAVSTECLKELPSASIARKAEIIQGFYEQVVFSPCGIAVSIPRMDGNTVRPFNKEDLEGQVRSNYGHWRHKPDGQWDLVNHENSTTTSGIYLASQTYRYQATRDPAALEQAQKAFNSLNLIYQLGEQDGRPGWMCKPFSFRVSDYTSPDQYLHASWGLFAYHEIASASTKARIEEMLVGFADYWRKAEYTLRFPNHVWNLSGAQHGYNLVLLMIQALAYHFTRAPVYLEEAKKFRAAGRWHQETEVDALKRAQKERRDFNGILGLNNTFRDLLKPGETICWECNGFTEFAAIGAENILRTAPELIQADMEETLARWWSIWKYGVGDDLMPYYWYAVDFEKDTWRPLPLTKPVADEKMPTLLFNSYVSQVRWFDPMARFMYTSVLAAKYAPRVAAQAKDLALRILQSTDENKLRWMLDLDGKQLLPHFRYMGQSLSSEMPATFLATYWRGRLENLW